jgi:hypothetical protein
MHMYELVCIFVASTQSWYKSPVGFNVEIM